MVSVHRRRDEPHRADELLGELVEAAAERPHHLGLDDGPRGLGHEQYEDVALGAGEQRRLGVALDRVVQPDPGQGPAHTIVRASDLVEVEREERRRQEERVERRRAEGIDGVRERAHARLRSRNSKAGIARA